MKRLTVLVILAILLEGPVLLKLGGNNISVADASTYNNEIISSMSKAHNSLASASITITMYTLPYS